MRHRKVASLKWKIIDFLVAYIIPQKLWWWWKKRYKDAA